MGQILLILFVIFMVLWLFGGSYLYYDPAKPHMLGGVLLPWLCVLILGLAVFGAVSASSSHLGGP